MNKKLLRLVLSLFAVSALCSTGFAAENSKEEGDSKEEVTKEKEESSKEKCTLSNCQSLSFSFSAAADLEGPSEEGAPEAPKTDVTVE